MSGNPFRARTPDSEAEKRIQILASLKLILFTLILAAAMSEIILITGDSALYGGKTQSIAWYWCVDAYCLAMIVDASYILGKNRQSAQAGLLRGIRGVLSGITLPILSPARLPVLLSVAAAAGMLITAASLAAVIL